MSWNSQGTIKYKKSQEIFLCDIHASSANLNFENFALTHTCPKTPLNGLGHT